MDDPSVAWPLITLGVGMAIVLGMILVFKANAFLALICSALVISLMTPVESPPAKPSVTSTKADKPTKPETDQAPKESKPAPPSVKVPNQVERVAIAFGNSAGGIGILIALAAIVGLCLMESGAADRIVNSFMGLLGEKRSSAALMGSGFVLSIPVFFDTVFYLLIPLARAITRKREGKDFLKYVLAIAAGGAVTHALVPPTPGPLKMADALGVDLGVMILVGAMVGIVPAIVGGLIFAPLANKLMPIPFRPLSETKEPEPLDPAQLPNLFVSLLPVLLPVLFIASATVTSTLNKSYALHGEVTTEGFQHLLKVTQILGNPSFAMLLAALIALALLKIQRGLTFGELAQRTEVALMSGGVIILITAAGGAFGGMLKAANVGAAIESQLVGQIGSEAQLTGLMMLCFGFGLASLLKIAQGSSTVAMITTVELIASMIGPETKLAFHPVYFATAIGSGSLVGSWMNDSGFWIVSKMSGMTEAETLRSLTVCWAILGITGFLTTLILANYLPLTSFMGV